MVAAAIRVANGRWIRKSYLVRTCGFTQAGARIFELENERHWKVEHSDFADEFGFRSFRILQEMEQLTMLQEKSPHCCGLFCITSLGIRLRRSRRLHSGRHNHNRHSRAAERSRSFHSTAERNRSFYNVVGSDDSRNGGNDASVDGAS
jgi:hypothetical protein